MSVLSYILSTILLSLAGVTAYLLIRPLRPTFGARRAILWLIVAASLSIPLTPPFTQANYRNIGTEMQRGARSPESTFSLSPVGRETIHDFCHCENPRAGDVLLYHSSLAYDFLLRNQQVLLIALTGLGCFLTLRILLRLIILWRQIRRHDSQWMEVDGLLIKIIRDVPGISAASLKLKHNYIFWNRSLDQLPAEDQRAILSHECGHLKDFNSWEKLFFACLQIIWWINPAFYFISKELELLSEYNADAHAIQAIGGSRKHYASLLLRIKTNEMVAPLQFFQGSRLKKRIEMVLLPSKRSALRLGPALLLWMGLMVPAEVLTKTIVEDQVQEIEVYEFLQERHHATGQMQFCKKCTYEIWESCYEPPKPECKLSPLRDD